MFSLIRRLLAGRSAPADAASAIDEQALTEELRARAAPALVIERAEKPTASKLGGWPDLAARHDWPTWRDTPLAFLAQVDCGTASAGGGPTWLPREGMLFFFYHPEQETWGFDPADRGSWRVIYDAHGPATDVAVPPPGLPGFAETGITFRPVRSIPDSQRLEDGDASVCDAMFDAINAERATMFGDAPHHQLGGFPEPIQNDDMELECELVSNGICCGDGTGYQTTEAAAFISAGGAGDWRLLLQLDSDDDADMMWGDSGMLYFWIRETEARAGDFSKAWMILQCC